VAAQLAASQEGLNSIEVVKIAFSRHGILSHLFMTKYVCPDCGILDCNII
jgi:hypothetical protein